MAALSNLWAMDEESLDTFIQARGHKLRASGHNGHAFRSPMLGDKLLAGACEMATCVVEIAVPPERVWPWIAQLMRSAGIYGWSALENPACRSARELVPGLPSPRIGDQVNNCLILAALETEREIVWAASEPLRLLGHEFSGLTLDYAVVPAAPPAEGRCRLVARLRFVAPGMTEQVATLLRETLELLLIGSQTARLRECIHAYELRREVGLNGAPPSGRHQAALFKPAPHSSAMRKAESGKAEPAAAAQ
jgi:hypothetical protein